MPHWAPESPVIEHFDEMAAALGRHTEIAQWLRENGWVVIDPVHAERTWPAACSHDAAVAEG